MGKIDSRIQFAMDRHDSRILGNRDDPKPRGRGLGPCPERGGCIVIPAFGDYFWRTDDFLKQEVKPFEAVDCRQIAQRRGVADDDHAPRR